MSVIIVIGRFILNQDVIDLLKKIPLGKDGELWLVDAVTEYIKQGGEVQVEKIKDGEWLTAGDPLHYLITNLKYALDRNDIGPELREFINKNICKNWLQITN